MSLSNDANLATVVIGADGSFNRKPSTFRGTIEKGGQFEPAKDRYHLYVGYGCPWATRTLITRKLKGLEALIAVSVVSPLLGANGWGFAKVDPYPGVDHDPLYDSDYLRDIYLRADPNYTGRYTVPVLWDKKTETIVNNESAEIIRIFNSAFDDLLLADSDSLNLKAAALDLYPAPHRQEIDVLNAWVYDTVNNGVYRCGFAKTQKAYEEAVFPLFASLDRLETILTDKDYLVGDRLTEADIRLFVTIIRFDVAYYGNFKCNVRTIRDGYPAIHLWLRKLYWGNPAFSETCRFDHIKRGYYSSHPSGSFSDTAQGSTVAAEPIIPVGPIPDIWEL